VAPAEISTRLHVDRELVKAIGIVNQGFDRDVILAGAQVVTGGERWRPSSGRQNGNGDAQNGGRENGNMGAERKSGTSEQPGDPSSSTNGELDVDAVAAGFERIIYPQKGPRSNRAQRIFEVFKGRENEAVPFEDVERRFTHTQHPRRDAASAISRMNRLLEKEGVGFEIVTEHTASVRLRHRQ
jgi:hypothetical protein